METYSTRQVARMVGINRSTLVAWLLSGKIKEPRRIRNGGIDARVWTARDVERVRKWKAAHYRKGRGRKKKA
jgi:DNA-binding transcriptional MerR regulator